MTIIYDKSGKKFDILHSVDVREHLKTGRYFLEDPSSKKNKLKKKTSGKVLRRKPKRSRLKGSSGVEASFGSEK